MLSITLTITDRALADFAQLPQALDQAVSGAIQQSAFVVHGTAKQKIQHGARTGRIYRRRKILHQTSAPGEPPKSNTGRLASSIDLKIKPLIANVGTNVNYGGFLETGTKKMQPRPWLKISLDENRTTIQSLIDNAIKSALK